MMSRRNCPYTLDVRLRASGPPSATEAFFNWLVSRDSTKSIFSRPARSVNAGGDPIAPYENVTLEICNYRVV